MAAIENVKCIGPDAHERDITNASTGAADPETSVISIRLDIDPESFHVDLKKALTNFSAGPGLSIVFITSRKDLPWPRDT